mmetsp:Transcript_5407/g.17923  ORF Transcript_5407/g.17923 Transcript_5407/m.17923 type:complete len:340 (+) Transcript_5407:976-1995(+)
MWSEETAEAFSMELAEGLEATDRAESRRSLLRTLLERVAEQVGPFGAILMRVGAEYDALLDAPTEADANERPLDRVVEAERGRAQATEENAVLKRELEARRDDLSHMEAERRELRDEAQELRGALAAAMSRGRDMERRVDAYERALGGGGGSSSGANSGAHAAPTGEATAVDEAIELAREMPPSARPASIRPDLGSGRLASVPPLPSAPSGIPALNLALIARLRAEDADEAGGDADGVASSHIVGIASKGAAADADGQMAYASDSDESVGDALVGHRAPAAPKRPACVPSLQFGALTPAPDYHDEFATREALSGGPGPLRSPRQSFSHAAEAIATLAPG